MKKGKREVKCVVWDLDGTLWDGILLESDDVKLKPGIIDIIRTLDSRGILQSVASKNDYESAVSKLREFGIEEYFLYPEINWNAKSESISCIQKNINIAMDSIILVDDSPFERDEVQYIHPEVTCIAAADFNRLIDHPRLKPRFITKDSQKRRMMYMHNIERRREEGEYKGPKADFLKSLEMRLYISRAQDDDLKRAEELTVRTHQLNTTGKTYDYSELKDLIGSNTYRIFISELIDKYGSHGKIGLALIEIKKDFWHLKLFLISCRVMSYGVGTAFLNYIMQEAKKVGKKFRTDFQQTNRNRMMYITFKFANFKTVESDDAGFILLENDLSQIQEIPPYFKLIIR